MSNRLSTRFFSLTPVAAVLLLPLAASAITTVTAPPPMCGGEAMPVEPPYKMVCALDQGISVDSPQDQGDNIRSALGRLTSSETGLFFPRGRYGVSGDLALRTGNVLVGSRVGTTNFVNPASKTSQITETFHSAKNILIDHLVLDNITVQTFHKKSNTVIRGNTFRNTTTRNAQIRVTGASVVTGNLLLREPKNPGIGVQLVGASNAQVVGNWIGEDRARRDARLAAVRPTTSDAHFTHALLSKAPMTGVLIRNNQVALTLETAPADQRYLAFLPDADRLTLDGNHFRLINGTDEIQTPSVTLRAPQDATVVGNSFLAVPLHLTAGDGETPRPTRQTNITANLFVEATVDTTQTTRGWDASGTTPDDLIFTSNRFLGGEPACMLSAPVPTIAGMTYGEADNRMKDTGLPAKACHLRSLSSQEALAHVPPAWRDAKAPTFYDERKPVPAMPRSTENGTDNRTDLGSSTIRTGDRGLRMPPAASVPRPAQGTPPTVPSDQGWRTWLSTELDALLHRMTAMFSGR
jgi:hypothetical protein